MPLAPHSIRAACVALMALVPHAVSAQVVVPVPVPEVVGTSYTIFFRGQPIGNEQIAVTRTAAGWTIASSGRLAPPLDIVARRVQARYTGEWQPVDFSFDGIVRGQPQTVRTIVEGTTARSDITINAQVSQKTDTIAADAVLALTNSFFGPYEALAARLKTAAPGSTISVYAVPQASFDVRIGDTADDRIQTSARLVAARRTHVTLLLPGAPVEADLWTEDNGRLVRMSLPAQAIEIVREDIASVSSRSVPISRPNDEPVKIPANGFVLAGTLSRPAQSPAQSPATRLPAVVLTAGSGPQDRDQMLFGIPILGELANALADAGFVVVRYDKRGIGQSGGRAESASLADFAEDLRASVKLLADRKDVDPKRIAVVGHSEGGAVALLAAAKDKRIATIVLVAANGMTGADLVLAQQKHILDKSTMSAEEKQAKVDLQKRIHEAVISGKGWEQLPPEVRKQVDNPEFQSILTNDPAKVMPDVRQPILIVQGELDTQVPPANADLLESLARKRKNAPPVEMVKVPGVNHLLVTAQTGEVSEYGSLRDKHVSATVTDAIVSWLKKTLSPAR
jgi:pimeloyl-ACP methyl ester carboxylesterase